MSQTKAQLIDAVDGSIVTADIADDAVNADKLASNAVVNASVDASAAIAGTKIAPDFGTQQISSGNITVSSNAPNISFVDGNDNPDYKISANSGALIFEDTTNSANRLIIQSGGTVDVQGNLDANSGLDVTGAITGTGDLTIDTNTLHVDSSNNRVGIGTTSPLSGCKLTVAGNGLDITGQNTAHSANSLRIGQEGSGLAQFRAYGPDTSTAGSFQFTTSKSNGLAGASNAMRIDSSGKVGIGTSSPAHKLHVEDSVSNVIVAKQTTNNGGFNTFTGVDSFGNVKFYASHNGRVGAAEGIIFGSDTAAANVLDDYEEGTYTPSFGYATDDGNKSYLLQVGQYTKIGSLVNVNIAIQLNNRGTGSGAVTISLPFTVADVLSGTSIEASGQGRYFFGLASSVTSIGLLASHSSTNATLHGTLGNAASASSTLTYAFLGNNASFRFSITYRTT